MSPRKDGAMQPRWGAGRRLRWAAAGLALVLTGCVGGGDDACDYTVSGVASMTDCVHLQAQRNCSINDFNPVDDTCTLTACLACALTPTGTPTLTPTPAPSEPATATATPSPTA